MFSPLRALAVAYALTGFGALALQVVWQRVLAIHAGVDLAASTTVVAAFMLGLGLGNLAGGALGDRLSPRRAVQLYGLSALGVAAFSLVSVRLFQHLPGLIPTSGVLASFALHGALLVLPTGLMGLSLPLLGRAALASGGGVAGAVGRLAAINTAGAAVGAFVTGWFLLGNLGFEGTAWLVAGLEALAAGLVLATWSGGGEGGEGQEPGAARDDVLPSGSDAAAWPWYLAFACTGAVALGYEVVFFRVVDAVMRSNSYTFAHVLTLYLALYAAGTWAGARVARKVEEPGVAFLLAQAALGAAALFCLWLLVSMPPVLGMRQLLVTYFAGDGYLMGPELPTSGRAAMRFLFAHLTGPLLVMGLPVFLMGLSFPLVMQAARPGVAGVARRVAALQVANLLGNVGGSLLTGFVLIDALGTLGTVRLLSACLLVAGLLAVLWSRAPRLKGLALAACTATTLLLVGAPGNEDFWAFLHSAPRADFTLAEERSCVTALVRRGSEEVLYINATSQNGWPFDDFHVLIGLLPSLLQEAPRASFAIGLGAGSTAWALLQDARVAEMRCVELCGGELKLLRALASRGARELGELLGDARAHLVVGDGRKDLEDSAARYDVISVDALRPNSAFSGNVYSLEFYRLVAGRLSPGGLFSQWVPTARVQETVAQVFPHVVAVEVPGGRGRFLLASLSPVPSDWSQAAARLEALRGRFSGEQFSRLRGLLAGSTAQVLRQGGPPPPVPPGGLNQDLFPRDEYFLQAR